MSDLKEIKRILGTDTKNQHVVTVVKRLAGGRVRCDNDDVIAGNYPVGTVLIINGSTVLKQVSSGSVHLR